MAQEHGAGRGDEVNEFLYDFFAATTAEDQRSYFSGEVQRRTQPVISNATSVEPGVYRVIDGRLCRVLSGLGTEEVRERLVAAAKS